MTGLYGSSLAQAHGAQPAPGLGSEMGSLDSQI